MKGQKRGRGAKMLKRLKRTIKVLFFPLAIIFIATSFTGAYFSDSVSVSGNTFEAGSWGGGSPPPGPAEVVINEFLPNPVGPEPAGEWIELFNKGGSSIDVDGWFLYDAIDTHSLPITSVNVVGGSTVIGVGGYLVVNYQSPSTFSLNNTGPESVRLYDGVIGTGSLIDSDAYTGTTEGKSRARVPDGTGSFSNNHNPTPGGENS